MDFDDKILYLCDVYLTRINLTAVTLWISDFRITNCENTKKNNNRVMGWSPRKENGLQTRNRRLSESQISESQNHKSQLEKSMFHFPNISKPPFKDYITN